MSVLACLDASNYNPAVCEYAAGFATAMDRSLTLLHAREAAEPRGASRRTLRRAAAQLQDIGVSQVEMRVTDAPLALAVSRSASVLAVLGKRGEASAPDRRDLGSCAAAVLREVEGPICLVSRVQLPMQRGLVLIDADPEHRRSVEAAARHGALNGLELDIILMQPPGVDGSRKLAWARERLGGREVEVFPLAEGSPERAAEQYMARHGADLIVVSREMLLNAEDPRQAPLERRGLWSWRTPIFVC